MGSVRFGGDEESQPSTSDSKKHKSSTSKKPLHDSGAVNYASFPRKLRSAIKKRGRESIVLPFATSRKQRRVSNGVGKLRENGAKRSRLVMKQGQITKDEEEVAETLNALADMFSETAKTNNPVLDGEPSKVKSSTMVEAGTSVTAAEDSTILEVKEESGKVNTEAGCHSSAKVENCLSLDDAEQPELEFSKQSASPRASGVQSYLSLGPRPQMSGSDMIQSRERVIVRDQGSPSEIRYDNSHYTEEDKYKCFLTSPGLSSTVLSSESQRSCLVSSASRFPAWSENASSATQPSVVENSCTADKIHHPQLALEPKKSRKRCSTHVCIAHLIKLLRKPETSKGLLQRPTQLTTSGGIEQGLHTSIENQKRTIHGSYGVLPINGFTHSAPEKDLAEVAIANLSHKSLHQNQQQYSKTSVLCSSLKQDSEFLSLAAGGSDSSEGISRSGYSFEALKQFRVSYQHPQNPSAMHFSLPPNAYSSTFGGHNSAEAAPQVQLPPYLSNTLGHKLESRQQIWTSQFRAQYNPGGVATQQPDWRNRGGDSTSLLNYAQAVFPHLHSALGSMHQHASAPLVPYVNSSLAPSDMERLHRRLNPAFERNGATLYSDNMQLLCNQHL